MDFFNLKTAYFIMGVHYFMMPAVIWLVLRHRRNPSVSAWSSGGVLFGLGLLLLSHRTQWPDWVTYDMANLMVCMGQLAGVQALRMELGRPLAGKRLAAMLVGFVTLYELAVWLDPDRKLQYLVSLAWLAAYFLACGLFAWRLGREQGLQSGYWLSAVCLPVVLVTLMHWLHVLRDLAPPGSLQTNAGTVGIALMGNLLAMVGTTCFLGLHLERAQKVSDKASEAQQDVATTSNLARQIAQLERERSMGMVSASAVHELSQPLTSIGLIAEHAQLDAEQRPEDGAALRGHLEQILQQSRHAAQILQRVRHYIAPREAQHTRLDLQQLNTQVLALLRQRLLSEQVHAEFTASQAPVWVVGDRVQLGLLLVTLYRHAIEASAGLGRRRVLVRIQTLGARVQVLVQDNGPGLSPQAIEQAAKGRGLFGPQAAEDLGVGLRIAHKIATEHQGQLLLNTLPGGGGLAQLDLPSA